ncbi:MAG: hypothetical protein ACRECR_03480 [Thermoplasmata archaeon]
MLAYLIAFSAGVPLPLHRRALPTLRGCSLLSREVIGVALALLFAATATETVIVRVVPGSRVGWPFSVGATGVSALLDVLAGLA